MIKNPHPRLIEHLLAKRLEPLAIMFSGGRTSGYMLHVLLEIYGGSFPEDRVKVLFQNTGRELPETLDFVQRCSSEWNVPITWLEFSSTEPNRLRVVDHDSASRKGEPFRDLFTMPVNHRDGTRSPLHRLPAPWNRTCTGELKLNLANRYLIKVLGWPRTYYSAVGLRVDELSRVIRQRRRTYRRYVSVHPLYNLGVSQHDVVDFWSEQAFDLDLDPSEGLGNCDLCFLKPADRIKKIIASRPYLADFWIELEEMPRKYRAFRPDRPSYRELRDQALAGNLGYEREDPFINDCSCTE